ncbi:hypothetical protein GCM10027277_17530 [Pseudoduganella ginsengisoli]
MHDLIENDSQFVIATHSPILLAYPDACIYQFTAQGISQIAYEETEHFRVTRDFLADPKRMLRILMER